MIQFEEADSVIPTNLLESELNHEEIRELEDRINSIELFSW